MKKTWMSLVALLLTVSMLLTLCACGASDTKRRDTDDDEDEEETTVTTTFNEEEEPITDKEDEPTVDGDKDTEGEEQEEPSKPVTDPNSIVGEWKGSIVLDDWLRMLIGTPSEDDAQYEMLTKLYDVLVDDITLDYYMEFNEDGTAAWKMKQTFVADMLDIVRNNMATYIAAGGVYELFETQGLSRDQTDAALAMKGMTAEEFGNMLLVAMEGGIQSSVSADSVMPDGVVKDGFYIGIGTYEHDRDEVVFTRKDGSESLFAVNLDDNVLMAKLFYFGGIPVDVTLTRA